MAKTLTKRKKIKAAPKTRKAKGAAKRLALPKLINLNSATDLFNKVEDDISSRPKRHQKDAIS